MTGYSDEKLKDLRLGFLRNCKPRTLRKMRQSRELEGHLQARADLTRGRCASLVESGVFEGQAWQWAIREVLLESEWD